MKRPLLALSMSLLPAVAPAQTTPGTYELRYIADGPEARVMASQTLTVN